MSAAVTTPWWIDDAKGDEQRTPSTIGVGCRRCGQRAPYRVTRDADSRCLGCGFSDAESAKDAIQKSRAALDNMMADPSFVAGVAFGEALKAARELSNPEGRRGYKRTSALAAVVAAQIANELQPIVSAVEMGSDDIGPAARRHVDEAAKRIDALCRALLGKS